MIYVWPTFSTLLLETHCSAMFISNLLQHICDMYVCIYLSVYLSLFIYFSSDPENIGAKLCRTVGVHNPRIRYNSNIYIYI